MIEPAAIKKIIWAVDVFEQNRKMHRIAARVLRDLVKQTGAVVDPVYILEIDESDFPIDLSEPKVKEHYQAAIKALRNLLIELKIDRIPGQTGGHVLVHNTVPIHFDHGVNLLAHYASNQDADAILVSTHGRSGLKRVFLGSFAEKLLLRSPVPVITMSPEIHFDRGLTRKGPHPFPQIVFPTDLGAGSKTVFKKVVMLCKRLGCQLNLYHCVSHPIEPLVQSGIYLLGGSWVPLFPHFGQEMDRQIRKAHAWARWSTMQKVSAQATVHTVMGSISESIITFAKDKNAAFITMEEQSGPISSSLLGSIVRQVVRHAPCPVLILRPSQVIKKSTTEDIETTVSQKSNKSGDKVA